MNKPVQGNQIADPTTVLRWSDNQAKFGIAYVTSQNYLGLSYNDGLKFLKKVGFNLVLKLEKKQTSTDTAIKFIVDPMGIPENYD